MNSEKNQTTPDDGFTDSDPQPIDVSVPETSNMEVSEVTSDASIESSSEPSEVPVTSETPSTPTPAPTVVVSKLSGLGWLLRVGVNSAAVVAVAALILFLMGIAQRTKWITANGFGGGAAEASGEATGGEAKRYICPMMCTPPSTEPGRCPVCAMELVEATLGGGGDGISVTIEAAARRLVGIQTAISKMGSVTRTIRTIGSIDFDESRLSTISAYVDGRLEKLYANYAGVRVSEGDDLAMIYSPQLYSAQTEFISSLEGGASVGRFSVGDLNLNEMARENLSELGMTNDQISELEKSGKPASRIRIKSPQSGTVIEKAAVEGDYVKTGQKIYQIADLTTVWIMLDLFPDDAASVRFGQQVEAEIQSIPGEVFTGRVAFIDPTVNRRTRTVRVRVEVMNFDARLRPGDYATARIAVPVIPTDLVYDPVLSGKYISPMHPQVIRDEPGKCPLCGMDLVSTLQLGYAAEPQPEQRVVTVPRDAVLLTGDAGVIYVETDPGRFEIRRVTVGPMTDTEAVIIEGLAAGETVATGGNFLIDSQMQLAGNPSLLDPSKAPSFSPGPLQLPQSEPLMLAGATAQQFDRAYDAYFEIQRAMAADTTPPPVALNTLLDALARLETFGDVPDEAQRQLGHARRSAGRMDGSLETARSAFRTVSQAMLRAAVSARGPKTAEALTHYYCAMVPGNGGDWMQPGGEIANPYRGIEMLTCGEVVADMALARGAEEQSGRGGDKESGRGGVGETSAEYLLDDEAPAIDQSALLSPSPTSPSPPLDKPPLDRAEADDA